MMTVACNRAFSLAVLVVLGASAHAGEPAVATVAAGTHTPFYPPSDAEREVELPAFALDTHPVTIGQYQAFLQEHASWQQGAPPAVFADESYLERWVGPADPGALPADLPATQVSWFAARAYCQAHGGDLPTVHQWEYAADATADAPHGARKDPDTLSRILAWYAEGPGVPLRPVGQAPPNHWGLHDLHGLIWEWTLDFNSQLISADIRESGEGENLRFCGAGALSARDVEDYASFMRFAFRSSLTASFATQNLGFRCAYPR